jgi:hypothetical protein
MEWRDLRELEKLNQSLLEASLLAMANGKPAIVIKSELYIEGEANLICLGQDFSGKTIIVSGVSMRRKGDKFVVTSNGIDILTNSLGDFYIDKPIYRMHLENFCDIANNPEGRKKTTTHASNSN